jgi:hypothetical protein
MIKNNGKKWKVCFRRLSQKEDNNQSAEQKTASFLLFLPNSFPIPY